jgi:hypothetical protein
VTRLEQSEASDRIRLDTLRRAADALGCDLVYLLVPRRPLTAVGPADATPLAEAERHGLRLPVLTRAELNRAEAENISHAMSWLFFSHRRLQPGSVTREAWLKGLHRRMYGQVWAWAGQYRMTDRFTWGGASLTAPGMLRRDYITALQAADTDGDFGPLIAFSHR